MPVLQAAQEALLHLFFPHTCAGCGTDVLSSRQQLCASCIHALPQTHFVTHANNPVEQSFWGRLPLRAAAAVYYETKGSLLQRIIYACKYGGNKELGLALGRLMGTALNNSNRFGKIDALVPLPLHPKKERKRGFNQSLLLCHGISEETGIPVLKNAVRRNTPTQSQTRKNREQRWENMKDRFEITRATALQHKHLLLVDDVTTTGATIEACGRALLQADEVSLSVLTLAYAGGN